MEDARSVHVVVPLTDIGQIPGVFQRKAERAQPATAQHGVELILTA